MKIPHSQVTISGPFRENSRARVEVVCLGEDLEALRRSLDAELLKATEPGQVVDLEAAS